MRLIFIIVFVAWGVYAIKIAIDTNKKAYDVEEGLSPLEYKKHRKKIIRKHISKIFIGLFLVLLIVLLLIFVESVID